MTASKYLINGRPLIVLPDLATVIGLNEAIVLQQIHYWLLQYENTEKTTHYHDDTWWVYNTYANWQKTNFPFWSERTIQRIILSLEKQGLLISREPNKAAWDHTKWYTIAYDVLDTKMAQNKALRQLGTIADDNLARQNHDNLARSNYTESNEHESTTETSGPTSFSMASNSNPQEPSQGEKQAATAKGQKEKAQTSRAISERVTKQQKSWPAHFDTLPPHLKIFAPLKRCLPATWTEVHIYLYLKWRNKRNDEKAPQTEIRNVEGIYNLFADKLKDTPSVTAISDFMTWYRSQDWVIEIAQRENMGIVEQVKLPKPENLATHLDKWLGSQASPRAPLSTMQAPQEVRTVKREIRSVGERAGVGI